MSVVLVFKGGLKLGGDWAVVNGSRPGTQMSPGHYDIINSWIAWACGFCILLYYSITPTKERFCTCYEILIKNEWRWFAWVTPPGRTNFHIAFSTISHIHLPHTVPWPSGWKRDAYQGSQSMEISFPRPHCFHVRGLRIILVATFSPIISCEFPEEHPLVQVDNVKFVPKFQGLKV